VLNKESNNIPSSLKIIRPDDWHLHVRDGQGLSSIVAHTARQCGRAIIMPNLVPPVINTQQAKSYQQRIINATPKSTSSFNPLMTLYLTDNTTPH